MPNEAIQQARAQLTELIEAARTGAIIPIRLKGQLEALDELLAKAEDEQPGAAPVEVPASVEEVIAQHGEFLSFAVHELRTPMTSIRGYADMLNTPSMGELNAMQKQFLDVIRTNARRMEGLLMDVSDLNRLNNNRLRLAPKMDMAKNVLQMVEKKVAPLVEELGRELVFDVPQGLPLLNLDSEQLTRALTKLIENGLRYSPQDGGKVTVSASAEGSKVIIKVSDNGIGMTPDELPQLGTLSWRSDNDVVRSFKGSGLGIPIAYGLIAALDGTVSVESEPDKGTTFTITLPGMS